MTKTKRPSLRPIHINKDTWFYESEKSLHFCSWVTEPRSGNRVCASFRVPWSKLAKTWPALQKDAPKHGRSRRLQEDASDPWADENQRIYDEKEARISGDDKRSL